MWFFCISSFKREQVALVDVPFFLSSLLFQHIVISFLHSAIIILMHYYPSSMLDHLTCIIAHLVSQLTPILLLYIVLVAFLFCTRKIILYPLLLHCVFGLKIPCELDRVKFSQIKHTIRTGDIILFNSTSHIARVLLQIVLQSPWYHIGIVLVNPSEYLLWSYGITKRSQRSPSNIYMFDSIVSVGGVRLAPIEHYLCKDFTLALAHFSMPGTICQSSLEKQISKRKHCYYEYNPWQLACAVWRANTGIDEKDAMFCSELVSSLLRTIGILRKSTIPCNVLPEDFVIHHKGLKFADKDMHYEKPMVLLAR